MKRIKAWWSWLKSAPIFTPYVDSIDTPTETDLKRWASSEWIEYQAWLFHHSFISLQEWRHLRRIVKKWHKPPVISLLTPVYNTEPTWLRDCIYSVQTQVYPHWELCLVDDGSTREDTRVLLAEYSERDPRIKVVFSAQNQGICGATNQALALATGEYAGFLDHDDRLAPDALFYVAEALRDNPAIDIVYTDRDMLSPHNMRFMHLCKPDWSPETLLSGNYLFHLLVYRRSLLQSLGGVRVGFEGSQDYDLILRAAEQQPVVHHIRRVLYHWRQHPQSVALAHNAKEYAYLAGVRALQESLDRRGIQATVSENTALWRGNYRVHLPVLATEQYQLVWLEAEQDWTAQINHACETAAESVQYLVFILQGVAEPSPECLQELLGWLQMPNIGLVTGQIIDEAEQIKHAGLVQRQGEAPLAVYQDQPVATFGYMAVTAIVRNVSAPHPALFAMSRTLWQQLGGLNTQYQRGYGVLDFALQALQQDWRTVYTPFAQTVAQHWLETEQFWPPSECESFNARWHTWLQQGDPYYNPYLTLNLVDMGLDLQWPTPTSVIELYEINTSKTQP